MTTPRRSDIGTPDGWYQAVPSDVSLSRIDVPFTNLTWFFIKASLAAALAFSVTSWLWVVIGTGVITLSAALLFALGVPGWLAPPPPPPPAVVAPGTTSGTVMTVAPEPIVIAPLDEEVVDEAPVEEPPMPVEPPLPVDPNAAATEAALREQLQKLREKK